MWILNVYFAIRRIDPMSIYSLNVLMLEKFGAVHGEEQH